MNIYCGFLGLGTAMVSPPAVGALFATYSEGQRRNTAMGVLGAGNPVGFILGSISSGLVTMEFDWHASFLVVCIFFLIMGLLSLWAIPSIPGRIDSRVGLKKFDWRGAIASITGVALVCAALTYVSSQRS